MVPDVVSRFWEVDDGLCERETQQAVMLTRSRTFKDVLTQELEFETGKRLVRNQAFVRAVNVGDRRNHSPEGFLEGHQGLKD